MLPASIRPQSTRDTRLIEKAIRQRWPIPEECRAAIIQRQIDLATSDKVEPRESTSAAKAILAAEAQNIEQEKLDRGLVAEQHLHLHQHEAVDYSKIPLIELERIEKELEQLASAGQAEPR